MRMRLDRALLLLGIVASMGASYRTPNFVVEAATPRIAEQVGQYAEHYRKEKAVLWLGREMPAWPEPCPLKVTVTMSGSGGATSFAFDRGRVLGQNMHIEGTLERLLASVLPHEVTHTVFAHHFRTPVPRWADEGGSVLSEDDIERNRHDGLVRQILNTPGRAMPLRRLFGLREYPSDVMTLYAQGYSVADFLVGSSNRSTFLSFVGAGMREGWDRAAQSYYRYNSVEELEQAWLSHLRQTKRPPVQLAQNTRPEEAAPASARVMVRQTVPPAQPFGDPARPIYRAQNDDNWNDPQQAGRATYLPEPSAVSRPPSSGGWQTPAPSASPPGVRLGPPEYLPNPGPSPASPYGYSR